MLPLEMRIDINNVSRNATLIYVLSLIVYVLSHFSLYFVLLEPELYCMTMKDGKYGKKS